MNEIPHALNRTPSDSGIADWLGVRAEFFTRTSCRDEPHGLRKILNTSFVRLTMSSFRLRDSGAKVAEHLTEIRAFYEAADEAYRQLRSLLFPGGLHCDCGTPEWIPTAWN